MENRGTLEECNHFIKGDVTASDVKTRALRVSKSSWVGLLRQKLKKEMAPEGRKSYRHKILRVSNNPTEKEKREDMAIKSRCATDKCHGTERTVSGKLKAENEKSISKMLTINKKRGFFPPLKQMKKLKDRDGLRPLKVKK